MQNEKESAKDGIPGLSRIPKIGKLFSYTRDKMVKTELVIFLKPTIVNNGAPPANADRLADYYDEVDMPAAQSAIEYR
jgi:general secretion pathway protein D